MKKLIIIFLLIITPLNVLAKDITANSLIKIANKTNDKITDNNEHTYLTIAPKNEITISSNEDIYGIYIVYELQSKRGIIKNDKKEITIGENNFLHEYIDLSHNFGLGKNYILEYNTEVKIADIYILGAGDIPEFVEIWQPPLKEADLLLISTHSDDEHLFFLGLLPTYVAKGAAVQVAYFTNHFNNPKRLHEQLHGLYTVKIKNYPIIGPVPDNYSNNLKQAIKNMNNKGITLEDAINYEVELLRRFKPLVVVNHDENGEYHHGQHMLNTYVFKIALEKANDKNYHSSSYEKYGLWNVFKTYIHLYKTNPIVMNYDEKLTYFDGLTAYEVSKKAYSKHLSQQWTWFTKWLNGPHNNYTKATDIKKYSPREFGLYKTLVGPDKNKNDMFENLKYRHEQITDNLIKEEITNKDKEENKNLTPKKSINNKSYIWLISSLIAIICLSFLIFTKFFFRK